MVDRTDIYYGEHDLDFFNSFAFAQSILLMAILAVWGYQPPFDLALVITALVFLPLIMSAESLTEGNILQSPATPTQGAKAYVFPQVFVIFVKGITDFQLSLYSAPVSENGYLSSILAETEPAIQAIFNNNLAPFVENFAIIAFTFLFFKFMMEADIRDKIPEALPSTLTLAVIASLPGALIFGVLHGQTDIFFFIRAVAIMLILLVMLFGEELTEEHLLPFGVTVGLTIGVHRAINLVEFGGYFKYLNTLFTASPDLLIQLGAFNLNPLAYIIIVFDLAMVGLVGWHYGKRIAGVAS